MAFSVTGCTNVNITRDNNVSSAEMQQWNKRVGEFIMEMIVVWSDVVQLIVSPSQAAHSNAV
jgi:hypothetical protein